MQLHYAPITQPCDRCGAQPDEQCKTDTGWPMAGFHAGRRAAVAGWTDERKRAALVELLADRQRRQRAGDAQVLPFRGRADR